MSNYRHTSAVVALAVLFGSSAAVTSSFAANTVNGSGASTANTQGNATDQRLMVSNDGFKAERDIAAARVAIFEGNTDAAKKLVKDAQSELSTVANQAPSAFPNATQGSGSSAKADAGKAANGSSGGTTANADLIPIDGQMVVADDMVLTPDKAAKVKEANQHLKNGETGKAMDTLKQGAIDVAFTRVLMPVSATTAHVKSAENLLNDGKYYEANLALKAAQDLLRTDTVALADTAAQASKITGVPPVGASASGSASTSADAKK